MADGSSVSLEAQCPAGRASCAERGHFVACVLFLQQPAGWVLPLVGRE
jgi:hypothetical protein